MGNAKSVFCGIRKSLFSKSFAPILLSLAPGFSPVIHHGQKVQPLERLSRFRQFNTGLVLMKGQP
jgi:hypothetical protein